MNWCNIFIPTAVAKGAVNELSVLESGNKRAAITTQRQSHSNSVPPSSHISISKRNLLYACLGLMLSFSAVGLKCDPCWTWLITFLSTCLISVLHHSDWQSITARANGLHPKRPDAAFSVGSSYHISHRQVGDISGGWRDSFAISCTSHNSQFIHK